MIGAAVVLLAVLVHAWLPTSGHERVLALLGRPRPLAPDAWLLARFTARAGRGPGQAATTRLLQSLVVELQAGMTTTQAFTHVLGAGCTDPEAVLRMPPTDDGAIWRDVAAVWAVADAAGLSLAGALQRIHGYALVEQEVAREIRSNLAAPRFAMLTLAMMPIMAWSMGSVTGADVVGFLVREPLGWACLLVGSLLLAGAAVWMRALAREAQR